MNPKDPGKQRPAGVERTSTGARRLRAGLLAVMLAALAPSAIFAHPDVQEQIAWITLALEKEPDNVTLWLRRSEVRRRAGQFERALSDADTAERLRPGWKEIGLERARTLFDAKRAREALEETDKFLKVQPDHAEALVLRARCRLKLGQTEAALQDYATALWRFAQPSPDLFLERARVQAALGRLAEAVMGLDEGITRLGPAPVLELAMIGYERQGGNFAAALARVEKLGARSSVKEPALALQADVLEQAGRLQEARKAFDQVLRGIEKYPDHRRGVSATLQLEKRARDGVRRVQAKLSRASVAAQPTGTNTNPLQNP